MSAWRGVGRECPVRTGEPGGRRVLRRLRRSLSPTCASCNAELRPDARFCDSCGARRRRRERTCAPDPGAPRRRRSSANATAIEGERRNVTVLFADAKGFTPLSETLDAEQVYSFIQRCIERMVAAVHRYEGTVTQFTGDGIMAIFGAPIAHEDSARRAVAAALEMQTALRELHRRGRASTPRSASA